MLKFCFTINQYSPFCCNNSNEPLLLHVRSCLLSVLCVHTVGRDLVRLHRTACLLSEYCELLSHNYSLTSEKICVFWNPVHPTSACMLVSSVSILHLSTPAAHWLLWSGCDWPSFRSAVGPVNSACPQIPCPFSLSPKCPVNSACPKMPCQFGLSQNALLIHTVPKCPFNSACPKIHCQ